MRADRLLTILLTLQLNGRVTTRELARRLEVSERTIHRDMEALGSAGVPVVAERGANGGWTLLDGYRTDLTGLNDAELHALFLQNPPRFLRDLGLDKASEAALIKLLAALPAARRDDAAFLRERMHIDSRGWAGDRFAEAVPHLGALQEALWRGCQVEISYARSGDGETYVRRISPLGLVVKGMLWYLVAAHDDPDTSEVLIRSYRVSRVLGVQPCDLPAQRPTDFDLAAYWANSVGEFRASLPRYPAALWLDPALLPRAQSWRYAQIDASTPCADGWLCLEITFDTEDEALACVLSCGPGAMVISPDALRARVIASGEALLRQYAAQP